MTDGQRRLACAIRPFRMADYCHVRELWANAGEGLRLRPSDERDEISKKLGRDPELFCVAEVEGRIVGVVMGAWDGRRGWLHHLAVDHAFHGLGIGTALIERVEQGLRHKGCLKINLLVAETNSAARRLYARLGYDEMTGYLGMGKELMPEDDAAVGCGEGS